VLSRERGDDPADGGTDGGVVVEEIDEER